MPAAGLLSFKKTKNMIILGLNLSHNSTACLLKDGAIVGCASEERFNRDKNSRGFPKESVKYLLRANNLKISDVDLVVHGGETIVPGWSLQFYNSGQSIIKFFRETIYRFMSLFPVADRIARLIYQTLADSQGRTYIYQSISNNLGVGSDRILLAPHHTSHAYAAYYGFVPEDLKKEPFLIITHDALGDKLCGLVLKTEGREIIKVAEMPMGNSLAALYGVITMLLGMKVNEHEYKVMGLAPYASIEEISKVYPVLRSLVEVRGLSFYSRLGMRALEIYIRNKLIGYRFDGIAGAIQKLAEDLTTELVRNAIKETGIRNLVLGGGFFMNIKVNKIIGELEEVDKLIVCPSGGDESLAIGAVYYVYEKYYQNNSSLAKPVYIPNLYLGPEFTEEEIVKSLEKKDKNDFSFRRCREIEKEIAKLLAKGEVVANFQGRMEWGARALGNRSILANPSHPEVIREINSQIKNRDFWMPFAASILAERADDYIVNPKNLSTDFMVLGFDTTDKGKIELKAGIHPYDYTARPQLVSTKVNTRYYKIIKEFEKLTGIGAVLNTSFNLHGEPIVCSPGDALKTLLNSGLKYLVLGNYLVVKNEK